jgi:hypothetical protein
MTALAKGVFESGTIVLCGVALGLAIANRHRPLGPAIQTIVLGNWLATWAFLLWYQTAAALIIVSGIGLAVDSGIEFYLALTDSSRFDQEYTAVQGVTWLVILVVQTTWVDRDDNNPASIMLALSLTLLLRVILTPYRTLVESDSTTLA